MATPTLVDDAAPAGTTPTDSQRVVSGLSQSVTGPINIARGLSGIGLTLACRALTTLSGLIRSWISPAEIEPDRAITLSDDAPARPAWRKPLLIGVIVAVVLAIGGVAFKLLRTPSAPPIAPEPPRVRPATGATGDSAPLTAEDIEDIEVIEPDVSAAEDDPRKKGE